MRLPLICHELRVRALPHVCVIPITVSILPTNIECFTSVQEDECARLPLSRSYSSSAFPPASSSTLGVFPREWLRAMRYILSCQRCQFRADANNLRDLGAQLNTHSSSCDDDSAVLIEGEQDQSEYGIEQPWSLVVSE